MQKPTKENIARAQIIEMEDGTRLWVGEEPEPRRHMDEANGWRVGISCSEQPQKCRIHA
jgi:hypothetical protein